MYKCASCGKQVGPRVPQRKKVLETRMVDHIDPAPKGYQGSTEWDGKSKVIITKGKTQIVREVGVCLACAGVD